METRAKDLKDFAMWNSTDSGIKFFNLGNTGLSQDLFIDGNLAIASSQICWERFPKFNDEFAMTFLNNQKWHDLTTQVEKSVPSNDPFITVSLKELVTSFFERSRTCSAECFLKPMEKANVSIGNFKNTPVMAIFVAISRFVFQLTGMKTSFSIDNTSQIGQMNRIVDFWNVKIPVFKIFVDKFCHITSVVSRFINQYTHEVYLSPG